MVICIVGVISLVSALVFMGYFHKHYLSKGRPAPEWTCLPFVVLLCGGLLAIMIGGMVWFDAREAEKGNRELILLQKFVDDNNGVVTINSRQVWTRWAGGYPAGHYYHGVGVVVKGATGEMHTIDVFGGEIPGPSQKWEVQTVMQGHKPRLTFVRELETQAQR